MPLQSCLRLLCTASIHDRSSFHLTYGCNNKETVESEFFYSMFCICCETVRLNDLYHMDVGLDYWIIYG